MSMFARTSDPVPRGTPKASLSARLSRKRPTQTPSASWLKSCTLNRVVTLITHSQASGYTTAHSLDTNKVETAVQAIDSATVDSSSSPVLAGALDIIDIVGGGVGAGGGAGAGAIGAGGCRADAGASAGAGGGAGAGAGSGAGVGAGGLDPPT
eukprot:scaffold65494_cov69-Phaeocystis_antarctica.AAC.1